MISGATGSVGTALIKELIENYEFRVIRAISNDENGLFSLKSIIRKNLSTYGDMKRKEKFLYKHFSLIMRYLNLLKIMTMNQCLKIKKLKERNLNILHMLS